ncbi:MAG: enoyl-CoA hydratase [Alphaproteobacteria bacterium]|nr:enoyl-CoA hydratase [Alphaproteobacteria bacterium]
MPDPDTPDAPALLLSADFGAITLITLNRPAARNSLSERMISQIHTRLQAIAGNRRIRAVVLAANGPAFCAGHDLRELTALRSDPDGGRAGFARVFDACSAMMQAIVDLPQPVIAAVHGVATAAGCQLVASCDLAVASATSRFATPGVDIGLFCSTPMVALSRNLPRKQALEMLLTGEPVDADRAQELGLVNRVVPAGTERDAALALAQLIARKSPQAIRFGKRAFHRQAEMNLAEAYRHAAEVMTENMMAADTTEGIAAFLGRRNPVWPET